VSNKKRPINARDLPLCSPIVELASEDDRLWFESHPGAEVRIRPIVAGEFGDNIVPRGAVVTVFQVRPGMRIRRVME
jgi:hypothetical protein